MRDNFLFRDLPKLTLLLKISLLLLAGVSTGCGIDRSASANDVPSRPHHTRGAAGGENISASLTEVKFVKVADTKSLLEKYPLLSNFVLREQKQDQTSNAGPRKLSLSYARIDDKNTFAIRSESSLLCGIQVCPTSFFRKFGTRVESIGDIPTDPAASIYFARCPAGARYIVLHTTDRMKDLWAYWRVATHDLKYETSEATFSSAAACQPDRKR